jgi:AraC-like DNA-binding protein
MHADPGGALAADYQRAFGVPPEFGAAQNALIFDAALLDLPFRTADPYLRHFLVTQADELMARLEPEARMASRVVQALNLLLSKGQPLTLDEVAATLKLPVRRVRLLLESEGETFRELLNTVRREAAAHYLKQGLTVSQTAYLLGFSEPSALQHAFKRWYKQSAGQFQSEQGHPAAEDGRKVSAFGKPRHSS